MYWIARGLILCISNLYKNILRFTIVLIERKAEKKLFLYNIGLYKHVYKFKDIVLLITVLIVSTNFKNQNKDYGNK